MVTSINLGNTFQQNGRTVVTGSQSGFDVKGLVDSLATIKALPATTLETKNKAIDKQLTAYTELRTILTKFQSTSDTLRNPPGVNNAAKNVFQYRTSTLSTNDGSAASNYVGITVEPGAQIQSFSIDSITQLAREAKQQSNILSLADTTTASAVSAAPGAGQLGAGTFTVKANDGGADVSITLNAGDTLQTVANTFNQNSSRTGIQANIIQVATGSYILTFTGTKTGQANGFDLGNVATVTSDPSGALSQLTFTTTQTAQDAQFTIDGIAIQRATNGISDVFSGITLSLKQPSIATGTQVAVNIVPDTTIVNNAINGFVDAYNEFRLFASVQSQRNDDGSPKDTAVLATDPTLRTIIDQINSQLTSVISGILSPDPSQLQDIGISFGNFAGDDTNPATKNILNVDTDKLSAALTSNFTGVKKLFEYNFTSDNAALSTFSVTKSIDVNNVQVVIDKAAGTYKATYGSTTVDLVASPIGSGPSFSLAGPAGSALEGLTLLYTGTTSATINTTITDGYGDRLYNLLNGALDATKGTLTTAVQSVSDQETRNKDEITKINDVVAKYRDQITQQYAALESALSKANSILQLLQAQSDARNNA